MLRTLIICPDSDLSRRLEAALHDTGRVTAVRRVDRPPEELQLSRILRAHGPHVVFLSIDSLEYCAAATAHIESLIPGLQVVAFGHTCDANILMSVMRTGVREFLGLPFEPVTVNACLDRLGANLRARPMSASTCDAVYSFLPSKPGVGTSTLAVNVAAAMAATDVPTLLADFDLNSGIVRFLTRAASEYSIMHAIQNAATMDEKLWEQIVNRRYGMDVLHAGRIAPEVRIEKPQLQHLMEYVRRNYGAVCLDLSGNLEKYSIELMHESKKIFVICTPELPSVHLAREKLTFLHHIDLADRAVILLNRQIRRPALSTKEIEQLVSVPIQTVFPNDYIGVSKAVAQGEPVARNTDFARQCASLAQELLARKPQATVEKRKFVEYFSILPGRFSLDGRRIV